MEIDYTVCARHACVIIRNCRARENKRALRLLHIQLNHHKCELKFWAHMHVC